MKLKISPSLLYHPATLDMELKFIYWYSSIFIQAFLTPKDLGGANSARTFLKRYFHHFAGNFLLFLVIDFS